MANLAIEIGKFLYPVGSLYYNSSVTTNPATLLGFGTWTAFGAGLVPVGYNASNALFDTLEEAGGSADAITVSHTHTATVTDPGHSHVIRTADDSNSQAGIYMANLNIYTTDNSTQSATTGISVSNSTTGSSGTNANYQPYITVAIWKRTV